MNEFEIIQHFFKRQAIIREDVVLGIGDDAACIQIPPQADILVSTDTLVAGTHFLEHWDPYDIACKAVMVNISDIAAMGGQPCWLSLSLTLPKANLPWLEAFSAGMHKSLQEYRIALVGGDLTRGPLSITITIQGLIPKGKMVKRKGAKANDLIFVSGSLGGAALALYLLQLNGPLLAEENKDLLEKLHRPQARVDLADVLQNFASAAIDISDGLGVDLQHLCEASCVGAVLNPLVIPIHASIEKYFADKALDFALQGGDDYQLCFTIPQEKRDSFLQVIKERSLQVYEIGVIIAERGIYFENDELKREPYFPKGFQHFS